MTLLQSCTDLYAFDSLILRWFKAAGKNACKYIRCLDVLFSPEPTDFILHESHEFLAIMLSTVHWFSFYDILEVALSQRDMCVIGVEAYMSILHLISSTV